MNMKASHFQIYPIYRNESKNSKLKKVSSMEKIENQNNTYRKMNIGALLEAEKNDLKRIRKKPIIKSALKNSIEKLNQKKNNVRHIICQHIKDKEVLMIKDKNDLYYEEILLFQETCEKALERLFKEKMKKVIQEKQNEIDLFSSNIKTNFDSGDEISFGAVPENEKTDLDNEYDQKFNDVFIQYINKFYYFHNFNKIYSMYMKDIYDDIVEKINNAINPANNNYKKKVQFK